MAIIIEGNPNLSQSIRLARDLGIAVEEVRGTGELRFRAPRPELHPVRVNGRRKDSPKQLIRLLRIMAEAA